MASCSNELGDGTFESTTKRESGGRFRPPREPRQRLDGSPRTSSDDPKGSGSAWSRFRSKMEVERSRRPPRA